MNLDQTLGQIRPILSLIGSALIVIGLLVFFGANIHIFNGSGLEIGVAGFLTKSI